MDLLFQAVANVLDRPVRVLDAIADDAERLVGLAELLSGRARDVPGEDPVAIVNACLHGTAPRPTEAFRALERWLRDHGASKASANVSCGDALSFAADPVQGQLFEPTPVQRPPHGFEAAPFDVVIGDVPRLVLSAEERERFRGRYLSAIGHFTGEALMVERLVGLTAVGGLLVARLRSAVLRRDFGRALVEDVLSRGDILSVQLEGDHVILVFRRGLAVQPSSVSLIRAFGEERAAAALAHLELESQPLASHVDGVIGSTSTPGCDEVWLSNEPQTRIPSRPMVRGEDIGNLRFDQIRAVIWPYDDDGHSLPTPNTLVTDQLAPFRAYLEERRFFGKTLEERGLRWFDYLDHHPDRWANTPTVVVARAGRFVRAALARGPIVVGTSALGFTPRDDKSSALLLGVLSSSIGTFWMKHAFHLHGSGEYSAFEATAQGLGEFPVPRDEVDLVSGIAQRCERLARSILAPGTAIEGAPERLADRLAAVREANERAARQLAFWQEELDWAVYRAYRCTEASATRAWTDDWNGERAYETDDDGGDPVLATRIELIETNALVGAVETAEYKRPTLTLPQAAEASDLTDWLVDRIARAFQSGRLPRDRPVSEEEIETAIRSEALAAAVLDRLQRPIAHLVLDFAVPWEPASVFAPHGLKKWKRVAKGAAEPFLFEDYAAVTSRFPPSSASAHRRRMWSLRGRYNRPGERFYHLALLSELMERPLFAWRGASESELEGLARTIEQESGTPQLDLDRFVSLKAELRTCAPLTTAELAQKMWEKGWSLQEVESVLAALESAGAVRFEDERWKLV